MLASNLEETNWGLNIKHVFLFFISGFVLSRSFNRLARIFCTVSFTYVRATSIFNKDEINFVTLKVRINIIFLQPLISKSDSFAHEDVAVSACDGGVEHSSYVRGSA